MLLGIIGVNGVTRWLIFLVDGYLTNDQQSPAQGVHSLVQHGANVHSYIPHSVYKRNNMHTHEFSPHIIHRTILHLACVKGMTDVVSKLLKTYNDVNDVVEDELACAVVAAAAWKKMNILHILLDFIHSGGEHPSQKVFITFAVALGHVCDAHPPDEA